MIEKKMKRLTAPFRQGSFRDIHCASQSKPDFLNDLPFTCQLNDFWIKILFNSFFCSNQIHTRDVYVMGARTPFEKHNLNREQNI